MKATLPDGTVLEANSAEELQQLKGLMGSSQPQQPQQTKPPKPTPKADQSRNGNQTQLRRVEPVAGDEAFYALVKEKGFPAAITEAVSGALGFDVKQGFDILSQQVQTANTVASYSTAAQALSRAGAEPTDENVREMFSLMKAEGATPNSYKELSEYAKKAVTNEWIAKAEPEQTQKSTDKKASDSKAKPGVNGHAAAHQQPLASTSEAQFPGLSREDSMDDEITPDQEQVRSVVREMTGGENGGSEEELMSIFSQAGIVVE